MHIPLSDNEIRSMLDVSRDTLEWLWERGHLQKTYFCEVRPEPSLARSTVFDVFQYALSTGALGVTLSHSDSALWVLELCEVSEGHEGELGLHDKKKLAEELTIAANYQGLVTTTADGVNIAKRVAEEYCRLAKRVAKMLTTDSTLILETRTTELSKV